MLGSPRGLPFLMFGICIFVVAAVIAYIASSISLCFVVTFVYIKTGRSIFAGVMVHMLSNLMGSQLLAPYDTEEGTVIRLVNILLCTAVAVYAVCSSGFQQELRAETGKIRAELGGKP